MEKYNGFNVISETKVSNEHALKLLEEFGRSENFYPESSYLVITIENGQEALFQFGYDTPDIETSELRENCTSLNSY